MPVTTYISNSELLVYTKVADPEVDYLLQEVRKKFNDKVFLRQREHWKKRWIGANTLTFSYTIYFDVGRLPEVHVMTFPPSENEKLSIHIVASKQLVMTFFYGLLNNINA